jgi:hypothetical protein
MNLIKSWKIRCDTFIYIFFKLDLRKGLIFLILVTLLIVSVAAYFLDPNTYAFFQIISAISIIISFVELLLDVFSYDDLKLTENKSLESKFNIITASPAEEMDGFFNIKNDQIPESNILYSNNFNDFIVNAENDFKIELNEQNKKDLHKSLKAQRTILSTILKWKCSDSIHRNVAFVNDHKISLCSPVRTNVESIEIFKVDYYSSFLTNEISTKNIIYSNNGKSYVGFDAAVTYPIYKSGERTHLQEFGDYLYGNHIGTSTIAISSNKFLCFWCQNAKAQQSSGLIVPTGSGSLDWNDYQSPMSLKELVVSGINRELYEESMERGVDLNKESIAETMLIGYFRRLVRGGKSEFLGISRLNVCKNSLTPNHSEVEDTSLLGDAIFHEVKTFFDLKTTVKSLIENRDAQIKMSTSLWANLLALDNLIEKDPMLVKRFFQYD